MEEMASKKDGERKEHFEGIAICADWLAYELPEAYRKEKLGRGQVHKWFLCRYLGAGDAIKPDGIEFVGYEWVEPSSLLDLTTPFRRSVCGRLLSDCAPHLGTTFHNCGYKP